MCRNAIIPILDNMPNKELSFVENASHSGNTIFRREQKHTPFEQPCLSSDAKPGELNIDDNKVQTPLLTAEEERQLIYKARKGDEEALDRLILSNLKLVFSIAGKFMGRGIDYDDLVQTGILGLIRATESFDPEKGRFSTHATPWIREKIFKEIYSQKRSVRLPVHLHLKLAKLRRIESRLQAILDREPNIEELVASSDMDRDLIRLLLTVRQPCISLNIPIDEKGRWVTETELGETELGETIPSQAFSPEEEAIYNDSIKIIRRVVEDLPEEEGTILKMYFGIGYNRSYTYREIASALNLTQRFVEKTVKITLGKLKEHPMLEDLFPLA
jgi:RNA polymerase sigma factor (sigma-70 family)